MKETHYEKVFAYKPFLAAAECLRPRHRTLVGIWRFDRGDDTTGEAVPKLNVQIRADKDYVMVVSSCFSFAILTANIC